jgi:hypothetical protein
MRADFSVAIGDIEVNPRVWINQINTREFALKLDCLGEIVLGPAVVRERQ